jgi:long-chain acyl-CoA synthetase
LKNKLIKSFKDNYQEIFVIDGIENDTYTYLDIHINTLKCVKFLESCDLNSQDKVIVVSDNNIDTVGLYFALLYMNIILIPINNKSTESEFEYISKEIDASKIIYVNSENTYSYNLNKSISFNSSSYKHYNINKNIEPFFNYNVDDISLIVYSSGTTGKPKGIIHKFSTLYKNAQLFNKAVGITNKNRFLNLLSLTYLGGYYNLLMLPFSANASIVLYKHFDINHLVKLPNLISEYSINTLWLVPSIVAIMNQFDRNDRNTLDIYMRYIDLVLVGTAPLAKHTRDVFENKYKLTLYENYGLSETLFVSTQSPLYKNNFDSKGKILEEIEILLEDDNELVVNTPFRSQGYYTKLKDSENFIEDNIFKTGDIAKVEDDILFIVDRKKDIIIRGGENISSVEIENFILDFQNIIDVAIIGVSHELYGEDIVAFIVADLKFNLKELRKYCGKNLNSKKVPSKYIEIEEIPKNKNGKKDKNKLKNILRSEYEYE